MQLFRITDAVGARRWQAVLAAAYDRDFVTLPADPLSEVLPMLLGDPATGELHELWLGVDGDLDVAAARLDLPVHDNLNSADVEVVVHPDHRRRGYGRAAAGALETRLREQRRPLVSAMVPGRLDRQRTPGEAYAADLGLMPKLADVRRLLDMRDLREETLTGLAAAAGTRSAGYTLLSWVDLAPVEHHAGLAALAGRMWLDAPAGDLAFEPPVWDAARWAAREEGSLARGRLRLGVLALAGKEVVGYSDVKVHRDHPEVGYQGDTIVRADHRGHRLGMRLKVALLRLVREHSPGTRWVTTWNAASNTYMISVNDAVGFRPVDTWTECQRDLLA